MDGWINNCIGMCQNWPADNYRCKQLAYVIEMFGAEQGPRLLYCTKCFFIQV